MVDDCLDPLWMNGIETLVSCLIRVAGIKSGRVGVAELLRRAGELCPYQAPGPRLMVNERPARHI